MIFFPKILDIKTDVYNTSEAIRYIRLDMCGIKVKFSNVVTGIEEAAKDVSLHGVELPDGLRLNRTSLDHNAHLVRKKLKEYKPVNYNYFRSRPMWQQTIHQHPPLYQHAAVTHRQLTHLRGITPPIGDSRPMK